MPKNAFIRAAALLISIVLPGANAQEAAPETDNATENVQTIAATTQKNTANTEVDVNGAKVVHGWLGRETVVFGADGAGKWRYFMHGQTDEKARPFGWDGVFQSVYRTYVDSRRVNTDVKTSELYSLCLPGGTDIVSDVPALDQSELNGRNGATFRMHVWLCGEETGIGGSLWESAPQVSLILRDGEGKDIARSESLFRTRGSFPWFCYYIDIAIPRDFTGTGSCGIYVRLANPVSGKAWFCTPSFELLKNEDTDASTAKLDSNLADPKRGTFAPNPDYDEMPMNFFLGLPEYDGCVWHFVQGNIQHPALVLSYDLDKYLKAYAEDWFHWTHSVPYLLHLYTVGMPQKKCPQMQIDWHKRLLTALCEFQNPKTGLWRAGKTDNLMVTYLIASRCFSPSRQSRTDREKSPTPWLAVDDHTLPNPDLLAKSILAEQNKLADGTLAGWNKYAFQGKDLAKASRDAVMFDMECSAAAVSLLSQCRPMVKESLKPEIDKAVKAAYDFAIHHAWRNNGLFYTDERQNAFALNAFPFLFLEGTAAMEMKRHGGSVPMPAVQPAFDKKNAVTLTITSFPTNAASIRVYALLNEQTEADLSDAMLMAVIKNAKAANDNCDPLAILQTFALKRADMQPTYTAEDANAVYIASKIKLLRDTLFVTAEQNGKIRLEYPTVLNSGRLVVMAADEYGYLSAPQTLDIP